MDSDNPSCAGFDHLYRVRRARDCAWFHDIENDTSIWVDCAQQPCPNRYDAWDDDDVDSERLRPSPEQTEFRALESRKQAQQFTIEKFDNNNKIVTLRFVPIPDVADNEFTPENPTQAASHLAFLQLLDNLSRMFSLFDCTQPLPPDEPTMTAPLISDQLMEILTGIATKLDVQLWKARKSWR